MLWNTSALNTQPSFYCYDTITLHCLSIRCYILQRLKIFPTMYKLKPISHNIHLCRNFPMGVNQGIFNDEKWHIWYVFTKVIVLSAHRNNINKNINLNKMALVAQYVSRSHIPYHIDYIYDFLSLVVILHTVCRLIWTRAHIRWDCGEQNIDRTTIKKSRSLDYCCNKIHVSK